MIQGIVLLTHFYPPPDVWIEPMKDLYFTDKPLVPGALLDKILETGWYRSGDKIFTTDFVEDGACRYPVYWLRYDVAKIKPTKSYQKIVQLNQKFSVHVMPFRLTDELEDLHRLYFNHIPFPTAFTIEELMADIHNKIFDSRLIEVRDNEKLIAAGIFDKGKQSIAGIKNIYHPAYKKYSLGKYLIWLKYQYGLQNKITWYYPGYFSPGNPRFDYKIEFDKNATEVCVPPEKKCWVPLNEFKIPPLI